MKTLIMLMIFVLPAMAQDYEVQYGRYEQSEKEKAWEKSQEAYRMQLKELISVDFFNGEFSYYGEKKPWLIGRTRGEFKKLVRFAAYKHCVLVLVLRKTVPDSATLVEWFPDYEAEVMPWNVLDLYKLIRLTRLTPLGGKP